LAFNRFNKVTGKTMKKWQIWASVLILFFAGILIGFFGGSYTAKRMVAKTLDSDPGARERHITKWLSRKLDLNEEQRTEIRKIVIGSQAETRRIWSENLPRLRELRASDTASIKKILTPEQQKKYERLLQKIRERQQLRREKRQNGST
jgi:Spy/CpxP family protein refolding chaperone